MVSERIFIMKKGFINYSLFWLLALGLFNVAAFLIPNEMNSSFWIGYGAVSFAFVLQLISTALFFKKDLLKQRIGGFPVPVFCIMSLVTVLLCSIVCVITMKLIALIVCYLIVVMQYLGNILVSVSAGKTGAATGFIADLKKNTAALVQKAENTEIKTLTEEISAAAASADPFSDPDNALAKVESKILAELDKFSSAVEAADIESAKESAKQLLTFIKERNVKCKMLK